MLTSGDVVNLDPGAPEGSEAGMQRPAVVVTANRVLAVGPSVVQVVPLTRTLRGYESEVLVEPDGANGLKAPSAAQCQHIRAVATTRILRPSRRRWRRGHQPLRRTLRRSRPQPAESARK